MYNVHTIINWKIKLISSGLATQKLYFSTTKSDTKWPFSPASGNWPIWISWILDNFLVYAPRKMWMFKRQKECNDDPSEWVARSPGWVWLLYFKPDHIAAPNCATHPRLRRLYLKIKQANKWLLQTLHAELFFKRERFWWQGWRGFSLWTMKASGTSPTMDMRFTVMMTALRWASSKLKDNRTFFSYLRRKILIIFWNIWICITCGMEWFPQPSVVNLDGGHHMSHIGYFHVFFRHGWSLSIR